MRHVGCPITWEFQEVTWSGCGTVPRPDSRPCWTAVPTAGKPGGAPDTGACILMASPITKGLPGRQSAGQRLLCSWPCDPWAVGQMGAGWNGTSVGTKKSMTILPLLFYHSRRPLLGTCPQLSFFLMPSHTHRLLLEKPLGTG